MFFLTPRPPISDEEREWIESSLLRLIELFGKNYFLSRRTILPKPEAFPDRYTPNREGLLKLVERICSYMDVEFSRVDVHLYSESDDHIFRHLSSSERSRSGAAGLYFSPQEPAENFQIGIEASLLDKPTKLVATITHELGHVLLLGGGRIDRNEEDHEYLTDLLTVFLGLGIFTANAAFQFSQWQDGGRYGWSASRQGYMSEGMFGYSLAACSWMRRAPQPDWERHLCVNVRHAFRKGMKFLEKTGNTRLTRLG